MRKACILAVITAIAFMQIAPLGISATSYLNYRTQYFSQQTFAYANATSLQNIYINDSIYCAIVFQMPADSVQFLGLTLYSKWNSSSNQVRFQFIPYSSGGVFTTAGTYLYTGFVPSAMSDFAMVHINYSVTLNAEDTYNRTWMVYIWTDAKFSIKAEAGAPDVNISAVPRVSSWLSPWNNLPANYWIENMNSSYHPLVDVRFSTKENWMHAAPSYSAFNILATECLFGSASIVPSHFKTSFKFYFNVSSITDYDLYFNDTGLMKQTTDNGTQIPVDYRGRNYQYSSSQASYQVYYLDAYNDKGLVFIPAWISWNFTMRHRDAPTSLMLQIIMDAACAWYDYYSAEYNTSAYFWVLDLFILAAVCGLSYYAFRDKATTPKLLVVLTAGIAATYVQAFSSEFSYLCVAINVILIIWLWRDKNG